MQEFFCKTKILSGPGAVQALGEMGCRRLFLVVDPYFAKNGTAARLAKLSGAEAVEVFDKVQPDPTVALAAEGTAAVKAFAPDTVVALGGGSAMDCAKAMVYFSGLQLHFVAIPTTSGSGSEVTDFAILTHENVKHPLVDPILCPDTAILDTELLTELPRSLIADAGFDVLSHAAEAMVATNAGAMTDALAHAAFAKAFRSLKRSFDGDLCARAQMHEAATMAGIAFNRAGLGVCHALAHSLGGAFHIPHGRLNAILLPAVVELNAAAAAEKYAALAECAGIGTNARALAVRNLKTGLARLRRELELPQTLLQAGVDGYQLRRQKKDLIDAALADPCCKTNPVPVKAADVERILEAVSGG